jgi:tRNA threonylcarbamoyladenosine biosynthesis protein TsaB
MSSALHLALDTGSPTVSVALAQGGALVAERAVAMDRSSSLLLALVQEVLAEAGARPADLAGVVALRGPGSFTGLRIGLATVLGLHQALGVPATALETLRVLAASVPHPPRVVIAAVDALRGEWSAQAFLSRLPGRIGEPVLVSGAGLPGLVDDATDVLVTGFGVARLAETPGWPAELRLAEAGPLAATAARLASDPGTVWDPSFLTSPLYARPPAVTLPRARRPIQRPAQEAPSTGAR